MSSITNNNIQYVTIDVDLNKLAYVDSAANITSANIATAVDGGRKVHILPMHSLFGMDRLESVIICDCVINRVNGTTLTFNAVNTELRVQRVSATAGLNTSKPTIEGNETVASATLNVANRNIWNTRPLNRNGLTSVSGSLTAGEISVRDADAGNNSSIGGALVIYGSTPTAELTPALTNTGVLSITIGYKKVAR